jgi:hypothetical protein
MAIYFISDTQNWQFVIRPNLYLYVSTLSSNTFAPSSKSIWIILTLPIQVAYYFTLVN